MDIKQSLDKGLKLHAKICEKIDLTLDDSVYGSDLEVLLKAMDSVTKANITLMEQTRRYYEVFKREGAIEVPKIVEAVDAITPIDTDTYNNSKVGKMVISDEVDQKR
jgi:hypothetical protein